MKPSNKKIMLFVIPLLIIIEMLSLFLIFKTILVDKSEINENNINKTLDNSDMFAVMLEQEDGTYKEGDWPEEGYVYDDVKSGCIDSEGNIIENSLTYNQTTNKVSVRIESSTYCYLYFNIEVLTGNLKNIVESKATKYFGANGENAGYRYSGSNPNNFVSFNGELWRIIGSVPTCTSSGCGTSENLVKIIRTDSIGKLVTDAVYYEDSKGGWEDISLYKILNNYYYGMKDGTNSGYCYSYYYDSNDNTSTTCNYTEIGISSSSDYGKMIKKVYWNTGASYYTEATLETYTNELKVQTEQGYIGLMNTSDYGYAAEATFHNTSLEDYYSEGADKTNWLYNQVESWGEWNITPPYSATSYYLNSMDYGAIHSLAEFVGKEVRPVVYLDAEVYITSGKGTEDKPFQIALD